MLLFCPLLFWRFLKNFFFLKENFEVIFKVEKGKLLREPRVDFF